MGKPILILRLEGPLQSWGTRARWDIRDTAPEPTKSAIIGLLGCALGYGMHDPRLETLDRHLQFGTRIDHPGWLMRDYQTISGFLPTAKGGYKFSGGSKRNLAVLESDPDADPATILSPRAYLQEAAFLVGLAEWSGEDSLLEQCARALQDPVWPLYLGRKSCIPACPVFETLTHEYQSLEEAFQKHRWRWLGFNEKRKDFDKERRKIEHLIAYIEDPAGEFARQDSIRVNEARVYGFRHARRIHIPFQPEWIGEETP
jgi:CRISPR system Cascade subunit CasD